MLPKKTEWKSWSSMEKITYVAQLAAPIAILPTVIFAWLGWRETRLARFEQATFFIAEKAPNVAINNIALRGGILFGDFKNSGDSFASNLKANLTVFRMDGTLEHIYGTLEHIERKGRSEFGDEEINYTLKKNESMSIPLATLSEMEKASGMTPSSVEHFDINTAPVGNIVTPTLFISISYNDVLNNYYSTSITARLVQ